MSDRKILITPNKSKEVLLHSCCAPCSCEVIEAILTSKLKLEVFFYNPNIHPRKEYEIRKYENKRFCEKVGINFVDADYDKDNWFARIKGLENEPERGLRCTLCFDMRFERTALYAYEKGYTVFSSSLGISRWKDLNQINDCGLRAALRYDNLFYWTFNWRKKGGSERMIKISKKEKFYQQEYCGCVYSLRDTNKWRKKQCRDTIQRGVKFYQE